MNTPVTFNRQVKQVMVILILLLMVFVVVRELLYFLPGLLGAITLYILSRNSYFQLIYHRKWSKGWTAGLYLFIFFLIPVGLVYATWLMLKNQVGPFFNDPVFFLQEANRAIQNAQHDMGWFLFSEETLSDLQHRIAGLVPRLANDTANLLANQAILLFILYYMLIHGKEMEQFLGHVIPLKKTNVELLASETKRLVRASALGIPLISLIQGVTAMIGYLIFGVDNFVLWGFLTGLFAFFPVVGTMAIWVPLVLFMYASGDTWNATGLMLYSLIITGNVDYLSRITILRKWGHVHPVVTVLGVIVGLGLFGFIGFVFGPLLMNYIILLFRIYSNEFMIPENETAEPHPKH